MAASVTITLEGLPEVKRLLDQFQGRHLNNRTRRALRAGAKVFRNEMRSQGRRSDLPKTFAKTRTRAHRNPLGVSVSPKSPLSNIFEHGARRHSISAPVMAGPAGQRSRGEAFFARGAVSHPGMGARPFIGPVFDASERQAGDEFGKVLFEGIER